MGKPSNAIGYVRLSELREPDLDEDGQGRGNVDQKQRIRAYARKIGWKLGQIIVENDLSPGRGKTRAASAFKRRKVRLPDGRVEWRTVRPGFRESLAGLASGRFDGFVALDLDRAARDPRDLEDMIDVREEHRVPFESVTGSLRLANDADITMARVMVAVANKESRDKARRVAAARERQALNGQYGGGRRPYGFDDDGVTVRPAEADVIAECSIRFVQGASLREMAAELRKRNVPTVTGAAWTAETLRDILSRPRNAGRMVYRGEEIGDAPWKRIVGLETFRAVQRKLSDPSRRVGPGPAAKWVGTNIYLCGICTDADLTRRVGVHVRLAGRKPAYRCKEHNHLVRSVEHVDKLVIGTILARLAEPDAIDVFTPTKPDVDVAALQAEAKAVRDGLNQLAIDKALNKIDQEQLVAGTQAGRQRLVEIEQTVRAAVVDSPFAPLIGADDIHMEWAGLGLSHQRLVIARAVTVRILKSGRRGPGFDPATVDIRWNEDLAR